MKRFVGFSEALDLSLAAITCNGTEKLPLHQLTGRILAEDIYATVDCPSLSTSRKDGFAVISEDLHAATPQNPVELTLVGSLCAGDLPGLAIKTGQAIKVTTGAPIPESAGSVISEEFCQQQAMSIICNNTAETGKNILKRGADVKTGEQIAAAGDRLSPAMIGFMAAAGAAGAAAYKPPRTTVIASGDEVIAPGNPLPEGKLYASNMVELCAWLSAYGIPFAFEIVADKKEDIRRAIKRHLATTDIFITSGGAWGSEKDLIIRVVDALNWEGVYHRVRMGPGKPVGFGLLQNKPFFVLPGGPPSNEMAFLQLALPAIMKMTGDNSSVFPLIPAYLGEPVSGNKEWTQFIHARIEKRENQLYVFPFKLRSRLQSMARKEAIICIPEGRNGYQAGEIINVQIMNVP